MTVKIPKETLQVLRRAWGNPFTVQSDFARTHADLVALAASSGLITTRNMQDPHEPWGRCWRITSRGLLLIERNARP